MRHEAYASCLAPQASSPRSSFLVRRRLRSRKTFFLNLVFYFRDGPDKLRINTLCHTAKVFFDFNIGIHTMAFPEPGAVGINHSECWNGNTTSINQIGTSTNADQTAPCSRADQRTEALFTKIIRECITTRSTPAVNEHHFRTEIRKRWP